METLLKKLPKLPNPKWRYVLGPFGTLVTDTLLRMQWLHEAVPQYDGWYLALLAMIGSIGSIGTYMGLEGVAWGLRSLWPHFLKYEDPDYWKKVMPPAILTVLSELAFLGGIGMEALLVRDFFDNFAQAFLEAARTQMLSIVGVVAIMAAANSIKQAVANRRESHQKQ